MKTFKEILSVIILLGLILLLFISYGNQGKKRVEVHTVTDTVIIRDTVRDTVLVPVRSYLTRVDTVYLNDTIVKNNYITLPIETKEYRTEDYYARITGYQPRLEHMEVFPITRIVNRTETIRINRKNKFGVGIQVGYGVCEDKLRPYIGIGLSYNVFTF